MHDSDDQDGDNHEGSVFRLRQRAGHDKWTYQTVYSFCAQADCTDGSFPRGRLIADMAGNLYGTTATGGPTGHGEVFRLTPGGAFDVLYGFCPANRFLSRRRKPRRRADLSERGVRSLL